MLRTFIAVRIAESPALVDLHRRLSRLDESLRPVPVDNLHVTLKFLGPTERKKLDGIAAVMRDVAARHSAHEIELCGLGAFPNARRPSVIWVGIHNGDALGSIAAALESELSPLGFTPEQRPFRPHLTVLRIKSRPPEGLFSLLEEWHGKDFGTARIELIEFYQSELLRGGSRYKVLAEAPLAAG
jgi:2'-5' RNA ligase